MPRLSNKEISIGIISFLSVFLLSFLVSLFVWPKVFGSFPKTDTQSAEIILTSNTPDDSTVNIVLLGIGGAGHDGGSLTDAMVLLNINPKTRTAKIISIPRDIWVKLPSGENKINHAMVEGPGALKAAVETVTGISPQFFISIDFNSFQKLIDEIGRVTVNVPVAFDDHYYPIKGLENETCGFSPEKMEEVHKLYSGFELEKQFECRYEKLHFEQGRQQMDGGTALKFARSRHSAQHGGDFARSERQQALLLGIKDTLFSMKALDDVSKFFGNLRGFVDTDLDVTHAVSIAEMIINPESYQIKHITLTTNDVLSDGKSTTGAYIIFPKAGLHNWEEVKEYISSH